MCDHSWRSLLKQFRFQELSPCRVGVLEAVLASSRRKQLCCLLPAPEYLVLQPVLSCLNAFSSCVSSSNFLPVRITGDMVSKCSNTHVCFVSNSVEFSVILQWLSIIFVACSPDSAVNLGLGNQRLKGIYCYTRLLLPRWFAPLLSLTDETPSIKDTEMQNYREVSATFIFSLCHTKCAVTTASFPPICPSWLSDLCTYRYTKFFSSVSTYPARHVVLG